MSDVDSVWEAKSYLEEVCNNNTCSTCPLCDWDKDCIYLETVRVWAEWK